MTFGFIFFGVAIAFFTRGLDDQTDPYRFFHGCWHMFVGISAYFFWNAVTGPLGTPDLYHWPAGAGANVMELGSSGTARGGAAWDDSKP